MLITNTNQNVLISIKKLKGYDESILNHYCKLSNVSVEYAIYLYVSPRQLIGEEKVSDIFNIPGIKGSKPSNHMVGLIRSGCHLADSLKSIHNSLIT